MSEPESWPQIRDARIEAKDGRLYLWFHDGIVKRRKLLGDAPANWPNDSIPAGKKRYGKMRAENRPEVAYHRPAKWKNRRSERIPNRARPDDERG
jgi:hypothetical protein